MSGLLGHRPTTAAPHGATAARLPVLMYHAVGTPMPRGLEWLDVPPTVLAEQLATLRGARWELLGLTEAFAALAADPRRRVVALTFDDAYLDFAESAVEVLADQDARATLYAPTGHLGGPASWLPGGGADVPLMDDAALAEVARAGVEIGSHGDLHVPMDTLRPAGATASLRWSRRILQDLTGQPVDTVAYPHGYHSRHLRRQVVAAGYTHGVAIGHRVHVVGSDPTAVQRLAVRPDHRGQALLDLVEHGPAPLVPALKRVAGPAWRTARLLRERAAAATGEAAWR